LNFSTDWCWKYRHLDPASNAEEFADFAAFRPVMV
jgi:hypothetical protein